jgi:hypothetical protein
MPKWKARTQENILIINQVFDLNQSWKFSDSDSRTYSGVAHLISTRRLIALEEFAFGKEVAVQSGIAVSLIALQAVLCGVERSLRR